MFDFCFVVVLFFFFFVFVVVVVSLYIFIYGKIQVGFGTAFYFQTRRRVCNLKPC